MSSEPQQILIVTGRFYTEISDMLVAGAKRALEAAGGVCDVVEVPGAFEIPAAILYAAEGSAWAKSYDGYVALGCVIRGETTHYDYVCSESARGLMDLALGRKLAIGYGILTTETWEQAVVRADPQQKDKGGDAMRACLAMAALKNRFAGRQR
jgi:6,7-dimethyl-8-ribityllumazine synthase